MKRAIILMLDSFGIGATPDADQFGDAGANTLGHIAQACARGECDQRAVGRQRRKRPEPLPGGDQAVRTLRTADHAGAVGRDRVFDRGERIAAIAEQLAVQERLFRTQRSAGEGCGHRQSAQHE